LSDPFENIDNEVYLEKIKNLFYKYKIIIIVIVTIFILSALSFTVFNNYKNKEIDKVSNYYIRILSNYLKKKISKGDRCILNHYFFYFQLFHDFLN